MFDTAVRIRNVGKKYQIGTRVPYYTLADTVSNAVRAPFRWSHNHGQKNDDQSTFWALKGVSFDVKQGEVVGIIGPNGAGKSTLLKILSRITAPTEGKVDLFGRVGSLLEVGTGFHPELTGRENIYLSGSLLGMKKTDINQKFDEIVKFSEIEQFIDTPVKRYSSGMYVRLAFSVAAHLEPEILIIDEVLAVGDASFQKKCLGKMGNVAKEGRTVLFVSHNMQAVRRLCTRVIQLNHGKIDASGDVDIVVNNYLQKLTVNDNEGDLQKIIQTLPPDTAFKLRNIEMFQNGRRIQNTVLNGAPLEIKIYFSVFQKITGLRIFFDLCDTDENTLFRSFHDEQEDGIPTMEPGDYITQAVIPANILGPIQYELRFFAGIFNVRGILPPSGIRIPISVEKTGTYNKAYPTDAFRGKFGLIINWETKKEA